MREIKLGEGKFKVTIGIFKGREAIFIEPTEGVHEVGAIALTDQELHPEGIVLTFNSMKSAMVVIEQIARTFLPRS